MLTQEIIEQIMMEEKPNQREKIVLKNEATFAQIPSDIPASKQEEYIAKALAFYRRAEIHGRMISTITTMVFTMRGISKDAK